MSTDESHLNNPDPFTGIADKEVRVLPPDYSLKKIIGEDVDIRQIFSPENVEKAQAVINENKDSFLEWVMKDIEQLQESFKKLSLNQENAEAELRTLAKSAFVIKSQAGTFGFALATQVAKSLDDFCTTHPRPSTDHIKVIEKHIETLVLIFHKNISGDGGDVGKQLSESLFKLVAKYKTN